METETREVAPTCTACGSEHNTPEIEGQCLRCLADAMFHGSDYDCIGECITAINAWLKEKSEPALTPAQERIVAEIGRTYGWTFSDDWK